MLLAACSWVLLVFAKWEYALLHITDAPCAGLKEDGFILVPLQGIGQPGMILRQSPKCNGLNSCCSSAGVVRSRWHSQQGTSRHSPRQDCVQSVQAGLLHLTQHIGLLFSTLSFTLSCALLPSSSLVYCSVATPAGRSFTPLHA